MNNNTTRKHRLRCQSVHCFPVRIWTKKRICR